MKLINKFLIVFNTLHTDVNWLQKLVKLEKESETFKGFKSVLLKERLWFHQSNWNSFNQALFKLVIPI